MFKSIARRCDRYMACLPGMGGMSPNAPSSNLAFLACGVGGQEQTGKINRVCFEGDSGLSRALCTRYTIQMNHPHTWLPSKGVPGSVFFAPTLNFNIYETRTLKSYSF